MSTNVEEANQQPAGVADERSVAPLCSHCRMPLPAYDGGLRHYGTHTAHQENECLRLMQAEIDRLRTALQSIADFKGDDGQPMRNFMWVRGLARDALTTNAGLTGPQRPTQE